MTLSMRQSSLVVSRLLAIRYVAPHNNIEDMAASSTCSHMAVEDSE
jgi:hypothetical protein